MTDSLVVDIASRLVLKLVSLATEEVIRAWNLQEDLVTLRERLESIDALLCDVDTKKLHMYTIHNWFKKLEIVAHVADVLMDELSYEVTRQKVDNHQKVRNLFIPSKNGMLFRFKMAHKINSIHTSLDKIFKWAADLGLHPVAHLSLAVQPKVIRQTTPFEDESLIVGREDDISHLVQMVCKNYEQNLEVIAIVGMGGQGKTTLARMVYNSDVVINMFPKRMWVTVSEDFDFMKILNQMIVSLTSTASLLENAEGLIKDLQNNLKGERFLLVLDDVWNEKPEEWENLRNSLRAVGSYRGSNILVTTRKHEVVDAMRCSVSYQVKKLSDEHSWELFKQRAFAHGGLLETKAFATLGRQMVERCGGLPLAIKALGGLLHAKKSQEEWLLIENSEIWKSKGILSSLRLSYDNLPFSSLKRCFTYCSIMPKDSVIYKNELVQIWMALGFILPPIGSNLLMEDIGNEYFNILCWNSLLQDVQRDEFGNITSCKMHDLVHDLALDLSKPHSQPVKAGHMLNHIFGALYLRDRFLGDVLPYPRHLTVLVLNTSVVINELPSSLHKMKYLKYLDISCFRHRLPSYIMELYNLQTLRVWALQELPKKFFNLVNLRHFYLVNADARCMFIGIDRLTCLQTLPYFVVSRDQNCFIRQLGGLKNLKGELELYGLDEIENMKEACKANLCTKSSMERLKLVWRNNEDAMEAIEYNDKAVMEGLRPCENLKELTIYNFKGKEFASWIIMMTNLVKVTLRDCKRCEELPPLGHLPNLREMEIIGMDNVKVILSDFCGGLGSASSELSYSEATNTVTTMYPSLKNLILWGLPKLEKWLEPTMSTGPKDEHIVLVFPKLEVLKIEGCSKLTRIPSSCFRSLKKLMIKDLDNNMILGTIGEKLSSLTNLKLSDVRDGGGPSSSSDMDCVMDKLLKKNSLSLNILRLRSCQGLTCLIPGVALEKLEVIDCPDLTNINVVDGSSALKYIIIVGCPALQNREFVQRLSSTLVTLSLSCFWKESDKITWPFSFSSKVSFPNLISLTLNGWEKVMPILPAGELDDCLSSTFPSLTVLYLVDFEEVKALPDSLAKLPSLQKLFIWNCKNLRSLATFEKSHSLQYMDISGCPLLKERCRKNIGSEWFKIQHIPCINLQGKEPINV